mgnify:CR=1 FL=1
MTEVDNLELVIITGMSGAGKNRCYSKVLRTWAIFCIDNMPPSLIP